MAAIQTTLSIHNLKIFINMKNNKINNKFLIQFYINNLTKKYPLLKCLEPIEREEIEGGGAYIVNVYFDDTNNHNIKEIRKLAAELSADAMIDQNLDVAFNFIKNTQQ